MIVSWENAAESVLSFHLHSSSWKLYKDCLTSLGLILPKYEPLIILSVNVWVSWGNKTCRCFTLQNDAFCVSKSEFWQIDSCCSRTCFCCVNCIFKDQKNASSCSDWLGGSWMWIDIYGAWRISFYGGKKTRALALCVSAGSWPQISSLAPSKDGRPEDALQWKK